MELARLIVDELMEDGWFTLHYCCLVLIRSITGHDISGDSRQEAVNHVIQHFITLKKVMRCQLPRLHETDVQAAERAEVQGSIGLALNRVTN